jgi:ABC-type amino acid transport substrate-binding protein
MTFSIESNAPYRMDFIDKLNAVILNMKTDGITDKITNSFLH